MKQQPFPNLYEHVFSLYSQSSPLISNKVLPILTYCHNKEFIRGPSGPALFSIAIQPILVKVQKLHSATQLLAYLDDVFVIGPQADVLLALNALKESISAIGLHISIEKCELFCDTLISLAKWNMSQRSV